MSKSAIEANLKSYGLGISAIEAIHSWLFKVGGVLELQTRTKELSVQLLNVFLSKLPLGLQSITDEIQIMAFAGLSISIRAEESFTVRYEDLLRICETSYQIDEILDHELRYLCLNFHLTAATPSELAYLLLTSSTPDYDFSEVLQRTSEIVNFCLLDFRAL